MIGIEVLYKYADSNQYVSQNEQILNRDLIESVLCCIWRIRKMIAIIDYDCYYDEKTTVK